MTMKLWCLNFDFPSQQPFRVIIDEDGYVGDLRAHLGENEMLVDPIDPRRYLRYFEIDVWKIDGRVLLEDTSSWDAGNRRDHLAVVLSRVPPLKALQVDEVGSLATFYPRRYRALVGHQNLTNSKTPSQTADSASFRESQGKDFPVYDGRHPPDNGSNLAMPVSLYHPVFQTWLDRAFDNTLAPPAEVIAATAELMRCVSVLYHTEADSQYAIRKPLQDVLAHGLDTIVKSDLAMLDGCISIKMECNGTIRNVPILIEGEKGDSLNSKVDTSTQAAFSMRQTWAEHDLDIFRDLACCPTFLLAFSGCHLVICGAVLTDKCIVNRLATLWVGRNSIHDEDSTIHIARVFHALSLAINDLRNWYREVIATRPLFTRDSNRHPRFFPFVTSFPLNEATFSGDLVEFEYIQPLQIYSTCITFLAETKPVGDQDKVLVVVKFVQRYCPDVHRLLAARGMTPNLIYCGPIDASTPYPGCWKLVVMDFFDGKASFENNRHKDPDVRQMVTETVKCAHDEGFVLGDVRPTNVLVNGSGEVKLIDFDWTGREGEIRYPAHMSTGLWVDGVMAMGLIKRDHDQRMIDRWFN